MFIIASPAQNDVYHKTNDVTNVNVYLGLKQDYIYFFLQTTLPMYIKLASKIGVILSSIYKDMTLYPHMYQNVYDSLLQNRNGFYISVCNSRHILSVTLCLVPF